MIELCIGIFDLFTTQLFAEVPYSCIIVNSCSYMTCTIQGIRPSFQDPVSTTKNLPVFFFRVLCHCFTLEENCMYIYLDILTLVLSPKEGGGGNPHKLYIKNVFLAHQFIRQVLKCYSCCLQVVCISSFLSSDNISRRQHLEE